MVTHLYLIADSPTRPVGMLMGAQAGDGINPSPHANGTLQNHILEILEVYKGVENYLIPYSSSNSGIVGYFEITASELVHVLTNWWPTLPPYTI